MTTGEALLFALFSTPLGVVALLFIAAVGAAILIPKKATKKVAAVIAVLLLAALPIAYIGWEQETKKAKLKARYDESNAIFQERCKSAGEKILRTVEGVEGLALLKVRPDIRNTRDQFALTDPYGHDLGGEAYIETFLSSYNAIATEPPRQLGYDFVDAPDPSSGIVYRYTGNVTPPEEGRFRPKFNLVKTPITGAKSRYGVTYEDISTHEDRLHWIAGSSLRIIDLLTNEVMAERIGYMMDAGQGSTAGGSEPWERAARRACPAFKGSPTFYGQIAQAARFASKVIRPRGER